MSGFEPYNDVVRTLFENPVHAGDLQGSYAETLASDASESAGGARVMLFAGIADGMIAEMRFRVWGCPHLIAAAEMLCRDCEKGPVSRLSTFDRNAVMAKLSVPNEKTGKMLLLEDTLELLWAEHRSAG